MYVTDGHRIRKITSAAVVTAFAGATTNGLVNGTLSAARFNWPEGIAVDSNGDVYVSDTINCIIRKITAAGVVTSLAGNSNGIAGSANGTGNAASFYAPKGICIDASRNIYIADTHYSKIRKITMTALSVNDFDLTDLAIYPNPVTDLLNISINSEIQKVQIFDITGKQVKLINNNFNSFSVEDLKPGFYFLDVTIDGKSETKKFVKQ